jgi:hypothetical protein
MSVLVALGILCRALGSITSFDPGSFPSLLAVEEDKVDDAAKTRVVTQKSRLGRPAQHASVSAELRSRLPFRIALRALLLVCVAASCSPATNLQTPLPLPAVHLRPVESGVLHGCGGVAEPSTLAGSAHDPQVVWLERLAGRTRVDVVWPPGFTATFDPGLAVYDASGRQVLRAGDFVEGGCHAGDPRGLLVTPPFLAVSVSCGPIPVSECTDPITAIARRHGWPARELRSLTFVSRNGDYELLYEDGVHVRGRIDDLSAR